MTQTADQQEWSPNSDRLSRRDFSRLAQFINGYSGIKMPPNKITMVEGRLRRRVRDTGYPNLAEYCRYLFENGGLESETVHIIDAVTTNKTEFFREVEHFKILANTVLPGFVGARDPNGRISLKFWSAACSTGAEPYTIAMVVADFAKKMPGLQASILATDLSTEVLEEALLGIYPESMIAPVPMPMRRNYLLKAKDRSRGVVRIVPELRKMMKFARLNLMATSYPVDRDMHVIFCRNILIYFDRPTQEAVLSRLCDHLIPGGYLFLGHSESLSGFSLPLASIGKTAFRRI